MSKECSEHSFYSGRVGRLSVQAAQAGRLVIAPETSFIYVRSHPEADNGTRKARRRDIGLRWMPRYRRRANTGSVRDLPRSKWNPACHPASWSDSDEERQIRRSALGVRSAGTVIAGWTNRFGSA